MSPEQLVSAAVHAEQQKFEAREILLSTGRSRLPLWAVGVIYGCGIIIVAAGILEGRPVLDSLFFGLSVFAGIMCYRIRCEVSRINKRLDALLLLQKPTADLSSAVSGTSKNEN